ncbi:hypothetical protein BC827DRAFT_1159057 [Russula dissimulans]|nr:hypothetical protein BC827DRAFT_1159057 [Russula dissimulans]
MFLTSQNLRHQLNEERQNTRRLTLQREVEVKELRTTIDGHVCAITVYLFTSQSNKSSHTRDLHEARTSLVKAETSKTHLEQQVEELSRRLQGDAERLAVYERRFSAVNGTTHHIGTEGASPERQLEAEVADLRASLKVAEVDLAAARNHIQQFKEISQASEEALASLNTTHDQYKSTTEAQLSASWVCTKHVFESAREEWQADKKTLEDTIVDMAAAEKDLAEDRSSRESDARAREERVKVVPALSGRFIHFPLTRPVATRLLRRGIRVRVSAETAQAKLATSESSWSQQRQALDREIADLAARCKALTEQNDVLHKHLDNVSSQAARIRQTAYLRKEKEIVDMQLELGKQENGRLKTQIGYLTRDLEDTRATLSDERERAASSAGTDAQHAELVEKIQKLNLLHSEAHAKRWRELDVRLEALIQELDPLREGARTMQAELDAPKEHIGRLEEENRRWQERNNQSLIKYDRVDPTEFQSLKDEVAALEKMNLGQKEMITKNNQTYWQRMGALAAENTRLKSDLETARKESAVITEERDALRTSTPVASTSEPLAKEVEQLRQEMTALERALQEEKSKQPAQTSIPDTSDMDARLVRKLRRAYAGARPTSRGKGDVERPPEAPETKVSQEQWEAEQSLSRATMRLRRKPRPYARRRRSSERRNVAFACLMRSLVHGYDAAIKIAVEKATNELRNAPSANPEELVKRHAEESRELEKRLVAKYKEELNKAADAASAKTQESQPTPTPGPPQRQKIKKLLSTRQ